MKINKVIILLILAILSACRNEKEQQEKKMAKIEYSEIKIAEIKKGLYDTICVQLNDNQIKKVTEILNSKKETELRKTMPKYWLFIEFKNKSIRKYKITNNYFGEHDTYIKIKTENDFINVYENNLKTECEIEQ